MPGALLLLLAAAAAAADGSSATRPSPVPVSPPVYGHFGQGSRISFSGTSTVANGLGLRYGGMRILADAGWWTLAPALPKGPLSLTQLALSGGPAGATRAILAALKPGFHGLDEGRVLIDTMDCELPTVSVRTLILCESASLARSAVLSATTGLYRAILRRPGTFPLLVRDADGWAVFQVHAHEVVIDYAAGLDGSDPRMHRMRFLGDPPSVSRAWIRRLTPQAGLGEAFAHSPAFDRTQVVCQSSGLDFFLDFDPATGEALGVEMVGSLNDFQGSQTGFRFGR